MKAFYNKNMKKKVKNAGVEFRRENTERMDAINKFTLMG